MEGIASSFNILTVRAIYMHLLQDGTMFAATAPLHSTMSRINVILGNFTVIEPRENTEMLMSMVDQRTLTLSQYEEIYKKTIVSDQLMPETLGVNPEHFIVRYPSPQQVSHLCPRIDQVHSQRFFFLDRKEHEFQGIEVPFLRVLDDNKQERYVPLFLHNSTPPSDAVVSSSCELFPTQLSLLSELHREMPNTLSPPQQLDYLESLLEDSVRLGGESIILETLVTLSYALHDQKIRQYPLHSVAEICAIQQDTVTYHTILFIIRELAHRRRISFTADLRTGQFPVLPKTPRILRKEVQEYTKALCNWYEGAAPLEKIYAAIFKSLDKLGRPSNQNPSQLQDELSGIIEYSRGNVTETEQAALIDAVVELARTGTPTSNIRLKVLGTLIEIFVRDLKLENIDLLARSFVLFLKEGRFPFKERSRLTEMLLKNKAYLSQDALTFVVNQHKPVENAHYGYMRKRRLSGEDASSSKRQHIDFIEGKEKFSVVHYEWCI